MRGGSLRGVAQATGIRIRIGNIAGLQGIAWHHGFLLPEPLVTRPLSYCFQLRKSSLPSTRLRMPVVGASLSPFCHVQLP